MLSKHYFSVLLIVALLYGCTSILTAEEGTEALSPAAFEAWHNRRKTLVVASEAAKSGQLKPALQLLKQELTDPLPAELPHWPSNYTASELIQLRTMSALSNMSQQAALVEAYRRSQSEGEVALGKRLAIALGLTGRVSLNEDEDQGVLERCRKLLQEDTNDFIRATAARALAHIGHANPNTMARIESALRAGLQDKATRPNATCTRVYGNKVYLVRLEARSALLTLGFQLAPGEGIPYSD